MKQPNTLLYIAWAIAPFFANRAFAQSSNPTTQTATPTTVAATDTSAPRLMLKFSLTSLLEPNPCLQFAIEHQLHKRLYAQQELGLVTAYANDDLRRFWGIRARSELRLYTRTIAPTRANFYVAGEVFGKYTEQGDEQWYYRDNQAYAQRISRERHRLVFGASVAYGALEYFGDRFVTDFSVGLGVRSAHTLYDNLPDGVGSLVFGSNTLLYQLLTDTGDYAIAPNLVLGFKIGYVLR